MRMRWSRYFYYSSTTIRIVCSGDLPGSHRCDQEQVQLWQARPQHHRGLGRLQPPRHLRRLRGRHPQRRGPQVERLWTGPTWQCWGIYLCIQEGIFSRERETNVLCLLVFYNAIYVLMFSGLATSWCSASRRPPPSSPTSGSSSSWSSSRRTRWRCGRPSSPSSSSPSWSASRTPATRATWMPCFVR